MFIRSSWTLLMQTVRTRPLNNHRPTRSAKRHWGPTGGGGVDPQRHLRSQTAHTDPGAVTEVSEPRTQAGRTAIASLEVSARMVHH